MRRHSRRGRKWRAFIASTPFVDASRIAISVTAARSVSRRDHPASQRCTRGAHVRIDRVAMLRPRRTRAHPTRSNVAPSCARAHSTRNNVAPSAHTCTLDAQQRCAMVHTRAHDAQQRRALRAHVHTRHATTLRPRRTRAHSTRNNVAPWCTRAHTMRSSVTSRRLPAVPLDTSPQPAYTLSLQLRRS